MSSPIATPSAWVVMRYTGNVFRDPTEAEVKALAGQDGGTRRIDTGIPMFAFEGSGESYVSSEDAQAVAKTLMDKDNVLRWVFKSELAPEIKKVVSFTPTNGQRSNVTRIKS